MAPVEIISAVILGVVQGLTELLPISSSAHLIVVHRLLGWEAQGLVFDVALHVGTSAAILAYFWRDWIDLAREMLLGIRERQLLGNAQRRLACFLIVGTLPAAAAGVALGVYIETHLRSLLIPVFTLVAFGALMYFAERWSRQDRSLEKLTWADSLWIGLSQALALIPGVSRSGITISTALARDIDRISAARFSFLLSTPVIVGAGVLEGWHLVKAARTPAGSPGPEIQWLLMAVGAATAAITGFLCIRYFLRYLQTHTLTPFVIYRIIFAGVTLLVYLTYSR